MLNFECERCGNKYAIILIDQHEELFTECLSCNHMELIHDWEDKQQGQTVYAMVWIDKQ